MRFLGGRLRCMPSAIRGVEWTRFGDLRVSACCPHTVPLPPSAPFPTPRLLGSRSPAFCRYYEAVRLPRALLPPLGSSPCGAIPWVGLTVSLLGAGRPTASRPGCCSAGSSFPAFGPKDAIGSPKFPANPSDLCHALGPRSAPRGRSLRRSDMAPAIATAKAPTSYDFRGSITRLKPPLFTLRAVLADDYAKLASGG